MFADVGPGNCQISVNDARFGGGALCDESSKLNTTVVSGQKDPATCPPTSGRVEVCNYTYGTNGWLGVAQIWLSCRHIVQALP